MKRILTSFISIVFIFLFNNLYAQTGQEKIKTAYLFRFAQNIEWKNENEIKEFKIAYLGTDQPTLNALNALAAGKQIKGKNIKIIDLKSISDLKEPYPQIIFAGNDKNDLVGVLYKKIVGQNILLITDGYDDQRLVMINFIYPDGKKISFELNKKTLDDQKLTILPKLLLLGGSDINVRELYKKQEVELKAEKERVAKQKKLLEEQTRNIKKLNDEITAKQEALKKQKNEINIQIAKIEAQSESLIKIKGEVSEKERSLRNKIEELEKTKSAIEEQQKLIANQNAKVQQSKEKLSKLDAEIAKKQKDIEEKQAAINKQGTQLKEKDTEIDAKNNYLLIAALILIIILSLSVLLIRTNKARKKVNEELTIKEAQITERNEELLQTNEEINSQKEEIGKQKREMEIQYTSTQDSIRYAKTIQSAILPLKENLDKVMDSFVLFRPKDIVSGDFYWFTKLDAYKNLSEKTYIAAVDCTGHGVPGAFMSMIGSRILNEIVNEQKITTPSEILEELNKGVIKSLKQEQTENNDGMDICLCRLEKQPEGKILVTFSGAKRPLFFYKKEVDKFDFLKGDRKSIGGVRKTINEVHFTNQELLLSPGDFIYLTTDGYADQNNIQRKKIGTLQMQEIFKQIKGKSTAQQKEHLEKMLDEHQRGTKQRDDITVIGIKI